MFNQKAIFWFLAGAAIVGFLLDARQKRMGSRESNDNVAVILPFDPGTGTRAPEIVG